MWLQEWEDKLAALQKQTPEPPKPLNAEELAKRFPALSKDKYNIAVSGCSGVGKSTLLNSLRGLKAQDPGALLA